MHQQMLPEIKAKISENPRLLLIVILKGRHEFYTDLDQLNFGNAAQKCITLLVMNSYFMNQTPSRIRSLFDYVVWFDGGQFWEGGSQARLDQLSFPDIDFMIGKIVKFVNAANIRIVSMEESFVRIAAAMREKYGISGPKSEDADSFTSKIRMKIIARTQGIQTPNFQIISPAGLLQFDEYFDSIRQFLGFPMILKPAHGVGSTGVVEITNQQQLREWLLLHGETYSTYLAEESQDAVELILLALVKASRVQFFSPVLRFETSSLTALSTGRPIAIMPLSNADADIIDKSRKFAEKIINSMMSSLNSLVVVRIYLLKNVDPGAAGPTLKFSKISGRIPSPLACVSFEQNSGVSPETVHILTQIKDVELNELEKSTKFFALLAYPCADGVYAGAVNLSSFRVASEVKLIEKVKPGQPMTAAKDSSGICLQIHLRNENYDELTNDVRRLCAEFSPIIRKKSEVGRTGPGVLGETDQ